MTTGKIRYAVAGDMCVILMEGRLTYTLGVSFGAFIDGLFGKGTIRDVVVDLEQAVYLDSTMLGMLGKLANCLQRQAQHKVTIMAPCENVRQLLTNIGFDDVFTILRDRLLMAPALREIPAKEESRTEQAGMVGDAHRTLMEINSSNEIRFRNVVEMLDKDILNKANNPEGTV